MTIKYFANYDLMSVKAADLIHSELFLKPDMLLCGASGSSPLGTYRKLVERCPDDASVFKKLRLVKLDEWGGISMDNAQSCETFLRKNIVKPLKLKPNQYISFHSNSSDPLKECRKVDSYLQKNGPIDLCVLGLGLNGHVAFNEPASFLQPFCHVSNLSQASMKHPMATNMHEKPTFGLTLGMADIMQSRKILMLITGAGKTDVIRDFFSKRVTPQLPASFLWLHPNVTCLVDKQFSGEIG